MAECKISDQQYSGLFGCEGFAECCGDVAVDPVDAARGAERDVWLSAVGIGVHIADGHGGRDMEGCGAFGAFDNGACDAAFKLGCALQKSAMWVSMARSQRHARSRLCGGEASICDMRR